jgi:hypothetical protein
MIKMIISLLNYVDARRLAFYAAKRTEAEERLKWAGRNHDELKQTYAVLRKAKDIHCYYDRKKFNGNWITMEEAYALLHSQDPCSLREWTKEFEKYGTKCAQIERRINARSAQEARHLVGSRTVSSN